MRTITILNVNSALEEALWRLKVEGVVCRTRNGLVLMSPEPIMTKYLHPTQRVIFSALRDANPFFHLMEAIWMLGGHDDVAFPARYARQISEYSDDGLVLAGGYGARWRQRFGSDQLLTIANLLRNDPQTRRAVLQMWDCTTDLDAALGGGLDVPCNTHAYFSAVRGVLDMTVCCRSNDAVWGAYGANAFHFSFLQQFIAEATGIPIGSYYQLSNNLHIYTERPDVQRLFGVDTNDVIYRADDRYRLAGVSPTQLIQPHEMWEDFLQDVIDFLDDPDGDTQYRTEFFDATVSPMQIAHTAHRCKDSQGALSAARDVASPDLRIAATEWLTRRAA